MTASSPPRYAHVAATSLNQTVGDWFGNARRIHDAIREAKSRGAKLVSFPEMCIPGYSLGDRLLMRGTLERSWRTLTDLAQATQGIVACLGLPVLHRGVLYNAVAVVANGEIVGLTCKEHLAVGDVQYEARWYTGWEHGVVEEFTAPDGSVVPIGTLMFEADGLGTFAVEICEDGWKGIRPGSIYALAGAHFLVNPSASWFVLGKHARRRRICQQISAEDYCVYLYTSLMGCDATRLVFDGSVFIAQAGDVLEEGRRFIFDSEFEMVDRIIDVDSLVRARMEEGSWRTQVDALHRGEYGPVPLILQIDGDYSCGSAAPAPPPYWVPTEPRLDPSLDWLHERGFIPRELTPVDLAHLELELALAMALREYTGKCGIPGITLALSGGRDSSMCAVLVHRMHRYDTGLKGDELKAHMSGVFTTAYMGTDNSGSATQNAARSLAAEIGATHHDANIQQAVDTHLKLTKDLNGVELSWDEPRHDIPLQNVQARLRGSLIWMIANLNNHLLISTSNKSEAAVGYTTMDGDTSGGISPISDVPKSLVGSWLRWAMEYHDYTSLKNVFATAATAELRPPGEVQTDEDDLMPFHILDRLMFQFVQRGQEPLEMFHALWPELSDHYGGDPRPFAAHIHKFVKLFCRAQWKRERFAIGFRVTAFDLDPKTGFRFPPVQAPFREELGDLDMWIEHLMDEAGIEH